MSTPNAGLPTMSANMLQPSVPYNAAMQIIDALMQLVIVDKDLTAPPSTTDSDAGKVWIVGGSATGAWSGHDTELALCTGEDLWLFIQPKQGWRGYVIDEAGAIYAWSGSAWVVSGGGGGGGGSWGSITGTLSDQTDLQAALNAKAGNAYSIVTEGSAFTADPGVHDGMSRYVRAGGNVTFDDAEPYTAGMVFNIRATGSIELVQDGVTLTAPAGGSLDLAAGMAVQVVMTGATAGDVIGQTVAPP